MSAWVRDPAGEGTGPEAVGTGAVAEGAGADGTAATADAVAGPPAGLPELGTDGVPQAHVAVATRSETATIAGHGGMSVRRVRGSMAWIRRTHSDGWTSRMD